MTQPEQIDGAEDEAMDPPIIDGGQGRSPGVIAWCAVVVVATVFAAGCVLLLEVLAK